MCLRTKEAPSIFYYDCVENYEMYLTHWLCVTGLYVLAFSLHYKSNTYFKKQLNLNSVDGSLTLIGQISNRNFGMGCKSFLPWISRQLGCRRRNGWQMWGYCGTAQSRKLETLTNPFQTSTRTPGSHTPWHIANTRLSRSPSTNDRGGRERQHP